MDKIRKLTPGKSFKVSKRTKRLLVFRVMAAALLLSGVNQRVSFASPTENEIWHDPGKRMQQIAA